MIYKIEKIRRMGNSYQSILSSYFNLFIREANAIAIHPFIPQF